jgi:hypothetical protein
LRVKRPGRKGDHLSPPSTKVKSVELYLHSPYVFMVWYLVKHRDNLPLRLGLQRHPFYSGFPTRSICFIYPDDLGVICEDKSMKSSPPLSRVSGTISAIFPDEDLIEFLLLSLAPQPSLGHGLHEIRLNFLEASQQFSFLQGRVVSSTPNPHPGGPSLCIYISHRQGGCPF